MESTPYKVKWRDCFAGKDTWKDSSEPPDEPVIVFSVGWIVPDYLEGYLVLTDGWFERDGDLYYGGLTYIPEEMVIEKSSLGWVKSY